MPVSRQDARAQGFVKKTYGFGKYAKQYGILTKHDVATIRIHERGGDVDQLQHDHPDDEG